MKHKYFLSMLLAVNMLMVGSHQALAAAHGIAPVSCSVSVKALTVALGDLVPLQVTSTGATNGTYHCTYEGGAHANPLVSVNGQTVIPASGQGAYRCVVTVAGSQGSNTCEVSFSVSGVSPASQVGVPQDKNAKLVALLRQLLLYYQWQLEVLLKADGQ